MFSKPSLCNSSPDLLVLITGGLEISNFFIPCLGDKDVHLLLNTICYERQRNLCIVLRISIPNLGKKGREYFIKRPIKYCL